MAENIDLFWSFRSPYSYLATPDALALKSAYDIELTFRPVLPIALRDPSFFSPENIKRAKYIMLDWSRRAEMLGMPNHWPEPDPIVQDLKTLTIAQDQPYIYRLTYLGIEAQKQGKGIEFATEVSRVLFGGTKNWHVGDHLAKAATRAGLNFETMEAAIQTSEPYDVVLSENHRALEECGHWGVPTFVYRGEPFFGQDRVETLRWRLDKTAVERRGS